MQHFLIIQTAFIGDAILVSGAVKSIRDCAPESNIDIVVRKGNQSFYEDHPFVRNVFVWDKNSNKTGNLLKVVRDIRSTKYDAVFNFQRFFSTGLITSLSRAKLKVGFDKNPLSFLFGKTVKHVIGDGRHEVERNLELLQAALPEAKVARPQLFPSEEHYNSILPLRKERPYVTLSPNSVWETKKLPSKHFIHIMDQTNPEFNVYLLGGPGDKSFCEDIKNASSHPNVTVLAGRLSLLASTALMEYAQMNYVNDSAPLHLCSAVNAPVCAFFCSTVPEFGFTPLSDNQVVIETAEKLECRPCGLHGFKACPKEHFHCGEKMNMDRIPLFK